MQQYNNRDQQQNTKKESTRKRLFFARLLFCALLFVIGLLYLVRGVVGLSYVDTQLGRVAGLRDGIADDMQAHDELVADIEDLEKSLNEMTVDYWTQIIFGMVISITYGIMIIFVVIRFRRAQLNAAIPQNNISQGQMIAGKEDLNGSCQQVSGAQK